MKVTMLVLFCAGCAFVAWAAHRFFTRPFGKIEPAMRWFTRFSYIGGVLQVVDLVREDAVGRVRGLTAIAMMVAAHAILYWSLATHWYRRPSLAYSKDSPEFLVTRGPYSFVRHPFYSSYLLAWFAPFVFTGTLVTLLVALVATVFFEVAARQEESTFLASPLHADYARYVARTGRFLPNPWKMLRAALARSRDQCSR